MSRLLAHTLVVAQRATANFALQFRRIRSFHSLLPVFSAQVTDHDAAEAESDNSYEYEGISDLLSGVIPGDARSLLEAAVANAGEIQQTKPASSSAVDTYRSSAASATAAERAPSRARTNSFDFLSELSLNVDETTPVPELLQRLRNLQASCRRLMERALAAEAEAALLRSDK